MNSPLVSVIMPNFNYSHYIGQAITSVLNQTYKKIELLVVDDGSTDDSIQVISSFGSVLTVLHTANLGPSAARNAGIKASNGAWLAFIDSDDVWLPNKLEIQMSHLLSQPLEIISCRYKKIGSAAEVEKISPKQNICNQIWFEKNPTSSPFPPSTVVLSRQLFSLVGTWRQDLKRAEDFDFFRRCSKFGEIRILEDVLVEYRQHAKQISDNSVEQLRNNIMAINYLCVDLGIDSFWKSARIFLRLYTSYIKHSIKFRDFKLMCELFRIKSHFKLTDNYYLEYRM